MIRKFNYTNRKKIPKECINLSTNALNGNISFNAVLKISELDFSSNAKVYIEAYYGPVFFRFDFGEFSQIKQPDDTNITELQKISDKIYFRIKIVDEINGLILGYADKLNLSEDDQKSTASIFYVNAVQMDTHEIWRMNFDADSDGIPVLEVNNKIDGIRDIARGDYRFIALVFPSAIRMVLEKIAEADDFDRDGETWTSRWIAFTEDVLGVHTTPEKGDDEESLKDWYNDVIRSFCLKHNLYNQFIKTLI